MCTVILQGKCLIDFTLLVPVADGINSFPIVIFIHIFTHTYMYLLLSLCIQCVHDNNIIVCMYVLTV